MHPLVASRRIEPSSQQCDKECNPTFMNSDCLISQGRASHVSEYLCSTSLRRYALRLQQGDDRLHATMIGALGDVFRVVCNQMGKNCTGILVDTNADTLELHNKSWDRASFSDGDPTLLVVGEVEQKFGHLLLGVIFALAQEIHQSDANGQLILGIVLRERCQRGRRLFFAVSCAVAEQIQKGRDSPSVHDDLRTARLVLR